MSRSGNAAGAWRNRKNAPIPTFMPIEFINVASRRLTSRTSPVERLRKTPGPRIPSPDRHGVLHRFLSPSDAEIPASPSPMARPQGASSRTLRPTSASAVAVDREREPIGPIDDVGSLDPDAVDIVRDRVGQQRGAPTATPSRSACVSSQRIASRVLPGLAHPGGELVLERAVSEAALRPVAESTDRRSGPPAGKRRAGPPARPELGNPAQRDHASPGTETKLALDDLVRQSDPEPEDPDRERLAARSEAVGEAGQEGDRLLDLGLADEGAASLDPDEMTGRHKIEEGLPDRGDADAESLRVLLLGRQTSARGSHPTRSGRRIDRRIWSWSGSPVSG